MKLREFLSSMKGDFVIQLVSNNAYVDVSDTTRCTTCLEAEGKIEDGKWKWNQAGDFKDAEGEPISHLEARELSVDSTVNAT